MQDYSENYDIESLLPKIKSVAYYVKGRLPPEFELDDLVQIGNVSLLTSRDNFDVSRGVSFENYAMYKARGAMIDHARRYGTQRRGQGKMAKLIYGFKQDFLISNERFPSDTEIAKGLNITLAELAQYYESANSGRFISLDNNELDLEDEPDFDQAIFLESAKVGLKKLEERELLVLSLYFEQDLNLREIGEVMGLSEPRVYQIKGKALSKLNEFIHQRSA